MSASLAGLDTAKKICNVVRSLGDPKRVTAQGVKLTWTELEALLGQAFDAGSRASEEKDA